MRDIASRVALHRSIAAGAAICLLFAACSSSSSPTPTPTAQGPSAAAPSTAAATSAAASTGASSSGGASIVANKNYKIAMVDGQSTDPFFVTKAAGAKDEAKKVGATVNWQAPTEFDPSLQIPILDSVLASHPDFLIVHPTDKNALVAEIKKFKDAGIPVITTGADLADTTLRLGYISTDNVAGGGLEAKLLAQALGSAGGKVFLVTCPPGSPCGDVRRMGFETEVANQPSLKYLGAQIYNGSDTTDAVRVVQAELQKTPDVAGIAASDGASGLGAATAVSEANKSSQVKVVSYDASPDLVTALKAGHVYALVIQQSYNIGALAVDYAVQFLNGGFTVPDKTSLAPVVGTADNIGTPDIQKFLYAPTP